METIDPRPLPPWRREAFAEVEIEPDREAARERAETIGTRAGIVVYSDASGRQGHVGAAVAAVDDNLEVIESQHIYVGPMDRWSVGDLNMPIQLNSVLMRQIVKMFGSRRHIDVSPKTMLMQPLRQTVLSCNSCHL